jgi:hypothetical protein
MSTPTPEADDTPSRDDLDDLADEVADGAFISFDEHNDARDE